MGLRTAEHAAAVSLVLCLTIVSSLAQGLSWYQGCWHENPDSPLLSYEVSDLDSSKLTAVDCVRYCYTDFQEYAGILNGSICYCGSEYIHINYGAATEEECNVPCPGDASLPCGGDSTTSIYSVYGPYIEKITLTVPRVLVQENDAIVVELGVDLAGYPDFPIGVPGYNSSHFTDIDFSWDVAGTTKLKQAPVELIYMNATSNVVHSFSSAGTYTIDVIASNPISSLQASVNVTVIPPVPRHLEIGRLAGSGKIPSCIPEHSAIPEDAAVISGFVETEIKFQASVVFGANLTFSWEFSDDGSQVTESKTGCTGMVCREDIQAHSFAELGLYSVAVEVSNSLGSVHGLVYVIIVDKTVSNVTLNLKDGESYYNPLDFYQTVGFVVSLETAHRGDTTMHVDFGDGQLYEHILDDANMTVVGMHDPAHLHVVSNYGIGCNLNLMFDHTYDVPGSFNVTVTVESDYDDTQVVHLPRPIVVQDIILQPLIICDPVLDVNKPANFTVQVYSKTDHMLYKWQVTAETVNVSYSVEQTTDVFTYSFTKPDLYLISVNVSNLVSYAVVDYEVIVEEAIDEFHVDIDGPEVVMTGDLVSVVAYVKRGTDVYFVWDFGSYEFDQPETELLYSDGFAAIERANYTYSSSGRYDLVVTAENYISTRQKILEEQFIVQDAVAGLLLQGGQATLLGNATEITVSVSEGTDVMYDIDVGRGREAAKGFLNNEDLYTIKYTFNSSGVHSVAVYAYNNISVESSVINILVQEDIRVISIDVPGVVVPYEEVPLVALVDGEIPTRTDLMYTWTFGEKMVKTSVPVIGHVFSNDTSHHVTLTVNNFVAKKTSDVDFSVTLTPSLYLIHAVTSRVGQPTVFTLKMSDSKAVSITVDYGDGTIENISSSSAVTEYTWNYEYSATGVYQISLSVSDGSTTTLLNTVASKQEVISDLELTGPTDVKFYRPFKVLNWVATTDNGSAVMYEWTVDPLYIDTDAYHVNVLSQTWTTTYKWRSGAFSTPGIYNVSVTASNTLSQISASMVTVLQDPIIDFDVSVETALLGDPSTFIISIQGGKHFNLDVDFGDGDFVWLSTESNNLTETADYSQVVPRYIYRVEKHYSSIRQFTCNVSVTNQVSAVTKSVVAFVEEPITGLTLEADKMGVFARFERLMMVAEIASGTDVEFTWNFNDQSGQTDVQTIGNMSIAEHMFSAAGVYNVSVGVQNPLYSEPIILQYPHSFTVQEEIYHLDMYPLTNMYFATLELTSSGNYSTEEVVFDIFCYGSPVTFEVDYGDGSPNQIIEGEISMFGEAVVLGTHVYTKVGNYTVCVTASNQLGNESFCLDSLFYVQTPPHALTTDHSHLVTTFGNDTTIEVHLQAGTDVQFDWSMGDQTVYIDAGQSVTHRYLSPGMYVVTIEAFNMVHHLIHQVYVAVQNPVQGAEVHVESQLQKTGTPIVFSVVTLTESALEYEWDMGDGKGTSVTYIKQKTYTYTQPGTFPVTVTAINDISRVTSAPIEMEIQTVIEDLTILILSDSNPTLIGQTTELYPSFLAGSDMTFEWDFGDNQTLVTTDSFISHQYTSIGEYLVQLFVSNSVSNATAETTLFVLEEMCRPPELKIFNTHPQVVRWKDLQLEVDVIIDCEVTALTTYRWYIYKDSYAVELTDEQTVVDQRTLFIPSRTLDYGTYNLELEVRMNGTIVYSRADTTIEVLPSSLVAVIAGGTSRMIGSNVTVVLDGDVSYDPDFPDEDSLSYNWTCNLLSSPTVGCFDDEALGNMSSPLDTNSSILTFPSSLLKQDATIAFVFWLRVGKEGRSDVYISQVLEIGPGRPLEASLDCPQCATEVNSNNQITFTAACDDCYEDVIYSWELFVVLDGSGTNTLPASYRCVAADGSDYIQFLISPNNTETTSVVATTLSNNIDTNPQYNSGSEQDSSDLISNVIPVEDPVSRDYDSQGEYVYEVPGTAAPQDDLAEGDANGRQPASNTGQTFDYVEGDLTEGGSTGHRGSGDSTGTGEVVGEGEGNGRGTGSGTGTEGETTGGSENGNTESSENGDVDGVRDEDIPLVQEEHLVSKFTQELLLHETQTSTGLNGESLVIKDGVFDEGRTYSLAVTMTSSNGKVERQGLANIYFKVNTGPMWGKCMVSPGSGVEMDTVFSITCREWTDENLPLMYEISYSIGQGAPQELLYYGVKTIISFQLPAGDVNDGYNAYLHIAIVDSLGGKTKVCSMAVQVTPKPLDGSTSAENILHGYVVGKESQLYIYMQNGDDQSVQLYVRMVSSIINRLEPLDPRSLNFRLNLQTRQEIRLALLRAINFLTLRDANDVMQYSMILVTITASPDELSVKAMLLAAELVEKMTAVVLSATDISKDTSESVLNAIAAVTSNLLKASNGNYAIMSLLNKKIITVTIIESTTDLLTSHQKLHAIGEAALQIETEELSVYSGLYSQVSSVSVAKANTQFQFPSNMDELLADMERNVPRHCYGVQLLAFNGNPYTWSESSSKVATSVSSLELHDCVGDEMKIEHMKDGITMQLPRHTQEDEGQGNFTFDKKYVNYHEFNVSTANMEQSLHIVIELVPVDKRGFPINLVMSYDEPPTPYEHMFHRSFTEDVNYMKIYFPAGFFNNSGTYYLGMMDGEFGQYRYRPDSVTSRDYSFKIWWGECLYWNPMADTWISDGCQTIESSGYDSIHCKCNHLTNFGGGFFNSPNELSLTDIKQFERTTWNAVTSSFVGVLFAIFLILLVYCHHADTHDEKKRGTVYLQDNQPSDQQCYEVLVETGFRSGAGTTAKVSLVLHGDVGHSETRELTYENKPLFERNSRDRFIVSVPETLGNIYKIHVWHNNAGVSPSWFLSRMAVRDLITGQKWYFICEKWFAVEEDDGKVERDLFAQDHGVGFQKVLLAKGSQYFADYHLWSSVFTRPAHSRFSKVQRLTACLAILLVFMCFNAVWYRFNDRPEWSTHLGLIDVSIESVCVGIVTALIALPINGPIVMLFRRSRPRKVASQSEKLYTRKKRVSQISSNETVDTFLTSGQTDDADYPSLVEQTAWTWHSLQTWAQDKWRYRHRFQDLLSGSKESLHSDPGVVLDRDSSDQSSEPRGPVQVIQQQPSRPQQIPPQYDSTSCSSGFGDVSSEDRNRLLSDNDMATTETNSVTSTIYQEKANLSVHKKFQKIYIPYWCRYIAWFLIIQVIFWSAFFTILFGLSFEKSKSVMWIQSLYFSILQCVFITQPLVILVMSLLRACQYQYDIRVFDHTDDNTELQDPGDQPKSRLDYYGDFDDLAKGIAARQRSRYLRFARPPQEKELRKAKERMLKEKKMYSILKGWLFYCVLFICIMWICYGKFHNQHVMLNESVKNTFVRTPHPFTDIKSVSDFWTWCENDLLNGLYWDNWYNDRAVYEDRGTIMDGSLILLGNQASLRQLRVPPSSCSVPDQMSGLVDDCRAGYQSSNNYRSAYGPNETWTYRGSSDIVRYCKWGRFSHYDGEGYVVILNGSRLAASEQLQLLQEENWIDVNTRVVIVEFTLYNPPTNLFTSVALLLEMPGTGGVYPFPIVSSVMLYRYETFYDYFIMVWELMFLGLVVYSIKREIYKAIKEKKEYFLQIWTYIEILFSLFSLLFFGCYVYRCVYVNQISERLQATYHEQFVDISFLAFWDQVLRDVGGTIIFLVTLKVFHALRFLKVVAKIGNIVSCAIKQLLVFTLWYTVILIIFSAVGVLVFGSMTWAFSDIGFAVQTMTATIRGAYDYSELEKVYPVAVPVFYISYFIIILILLLGMMKSLLNRHYKESQKQDTSSVDFHEVLFFTWKKFLWCTGLQKPPSDEDANGEGMVPSEFTLAEFEYQVDELEFRINAISHQHGLPEKPYNYFDDSDGTYGIGDDGISSSGSEVRLFHGQKFDERIQRIEDDLYGQNPELKELVDYYRFDNGFISSDREKQLRSELEMEIFRQLQLQRQDGNLKIEQHDSGRDSVSDQQDLVVEEVPPSPLPSLRNSDGKIEFPKPLDDIGLTDDASVKSDQTAHTIIEVKPACCRKGQTGEDDRACSICNSESESTSSQCSSQRACHPTKDKQATKLSQRYTRYDSSTSGYTSDNIPMHFRQTKSAGSGRSKSLPRPPVSELIRDEPVDSSASSDVPKHSESFPTLNALFSSQENLYESTSEENVNKITKQRPKTCKEPEGKRKLRKTKTRGKGKGKTRMTDDDYTFNNAVHRSGSDSDSEIPTIQMYPYGTSKDCW